MLKQSQWQPKTLYTIQKQCQQSSCSLRTIQKQGENIGEVPVRVSDHYAIMFLRIY